MVFVVAEIGVNWDGDFELVKEMMLESANANFNFVKFQAFQPELVAKHPEASRVYNSSITSENIKKSRYKFRWTFRWTISRPLIR